MMAIDFQGITLHPKQYEIATDIVGNDCMYNVLCTSRQWGKSVLGIQLMLNYAMNNKGSQNMYTSPTYSQANKVFKELINGTHKGLISKNNAAENSIIFINGSELYFKSISQPDNLRGYSIDHMFCDEAALYNDRIFDEILRPMLTVKGKKCILFSTPKGKNYFYNLFQMADTTPDRYRHYQTNYLTNPYANLEEIEDARKVLPPNIFKAEYLGEFIDDGGDVFCNINQNATITKWGVPTGERCYAGIDVGRAEDSTVLTIMNSKGEVLFMSTQKLNEWSNIVNNIIIELDRYRPVNVQVEVNGIGDVFFELLSKKYSKCIPFLTTNESKKDVIESLILDFQENRILIPTKELFPSLINELNSFTYKYSVKTRKVVYGSRIGSHDDTVISLGLANHARKQFNNTGKYYII